MMSRGTIVIDEDRCKACNLCVAFCPQQCLVLAADNLNVNGYRPAELTADTCTGCGVCAIICPDACITVLRQRRLHKGG